jgi:SAM-dependent methyltransferase
MYSEESDFERHDQEVERFPDLLRSCHLSIPPNALVLDVGGDLGMHAWKLLPLCCQLYVTDVVSYSSIYDDHFLHLLEEKHRRNGRPFDLAIIVFVRSDAERQIFREDLFDVVISINSFEHIPDPGRAWSEIIRVSKENAVVYVELDPLWTSPGGGHFQDYVREPWAHLLWPVAEYQARMRSAGASDQEINDFPSAINRRIGRSVWRRRRMQRTRILPDFSRWGMAKWTSLSAGCVSWRSEPPSDGDEPGVGRRGQDGQTVALGRRGAPDCRARLGHVAGVRVDEPEEHRQGWSWSRQGSS